MKLGEQVELMSEPVEEWIKFVDKWNKRNEVIKNGNRQSKKKSE